MQIVLTQTRRRGARRAAFGAIAALLLTTAIALAVGHGGGWWQFFAFAIGPDLALFAGIGPGLEQGRLHPRAVGLYNALHSFWGPGLLAVVAAIALPGGYLVGALVWAFHISFDRSVGYGMRTRDGFQRS
jgi:hypothetical protein